MDYLSAIGQLQDEVRKAETFNTPLEQFMVDVGNMFTALMQEKIDEKNVNASYVMRQGLLNQSYSSGGQVGVEFTGEAEYTEYRDQGVSGTEVKRDTPFSFQSSYPSGAFVRSMDEWIRAKGLTLNPWAVAYSVLRKGYEGAKFVEKTFSEENLTAFEEALLTLSEQYVTGQFEKVIPNLK